MGGEADTNTLYEKTALEQEKMTGCGLYLLVLTEEGEPAVIKERRLIIL
jgi:hypothetical protein